MTGEAELCPQCGAAIHFSESEKELICPYCGATIVNPTWAPAARAEPSDDQDRITTNQIIASLLVLRRKLLTQGVLAPAQIVSVQPRTKTVVISDPTSDKGNGRMMSFELEVRPDGQPPFTAKVTALVQVAGLDKYQPGTMVYVKYNPQDPTQIALDHRQ